MGRITRRDIGRLLGASALGTLPVTHLDAGSATVQAHQFRDGFLWGAGTAAFQIEGALAEDGRGPSIWDDFSHLPGKIYGGQNADIACDSYHRYQEDIGLAKALGLSAYRFSISWSRIFPEGVGAANQKGLDYYRRLTDGLIEAGIRPFCTLYHWDLPKALEDRGGWVNRDTAKRFADYAGHVAGAIPAIRDFFTLNEMASFIEGGYGNGLNPPGRQVGRKMLAQASHHAVLAHGLAVRSVRAHAHGPISIGSAEVATVAIPMTSSPLDIEAARKATLDENASYVTVMNTGSYREAYLQALGKDRPEYTTEDMKIIGTQTDFQGLNIYFGRTVRHSENKLGYAIVPRPASYPHMETKWGTIDPEALYWGPKLFAETMGIKKIYISENGAAASDEIAADGSIYDTDRVMFLRQYLRQLHRATSEGVPVAGYFHWSLLDNFEWLEGYSKRFGLHHVDFETLRRTPKLSAGIYRDIIARNAV